jgi:hypothetical protein
MNPEILETELALLSGKLQALTNLNLALLMTHSNPERALMFWEILDSQAKLNKSSAAYQQGIDTLRTELDKTIVTLTASPSITH